MAPGSAYIIVVGNTKGGSGKSTVAMHLTVALLQLGHSVAVIDLDTQQRTLTRYIGNRHAFGKSHGRVQPVLPIDELGEVLPGGGAEEEEERLGALIAEVSATDDVVIIDTPGSETNLNRLAHGLADTVVTPVNDSLIDLDALVRVEGEAMRLGDLGPYAEMVLEAMSAKRRADGHSPDWIVMRNRLGSLDSRNKQAVVRVLKRLAPRLGFRMVAGFGERVIYRELFPKGLTMMDLFDIGDEVVPSVSHLAARQEVRSLVEAIRLPAPA